MTPELQGGKTSQSVPAFWGALSECSGAETGAGAPRLLGAGRRILQPPLGENRGGQILELGGLFLERP